MDKDSVPADQLSLSSNAPLYKRAFDEIEVLLGLNFFGLAGSMGRNGLVQLTAFENLGSVWPNVVACFVISFHTAAVGEALGVLIGVGFCGAMSSFSELVTDIFVESTSPKPNWPDYGYAVPLFMARLILEMSCCFAAYTCGQHFAALWSYMGIKKPPKSVEVGIRRITGLLGILGWAACLVTSITSHNNVRWWALNGVFAPFGVWIRYYLSRLNKPGLHGKKYGTFIANVIATLFACILQMCSLMPYPSPLQKQILLGLQRGFCGCMSTISTFIKELETLALVHAYIYAILSLFVSYSLAVVTIGSWKWTH